MASNPATDLGPSAIAVWFPRLPLSAQRELTSAPDAQLTGTLSLAVRRARRLMPTHNKLTPAEIRWLSRQSFIARYVAADRAWRNANAQVSADADSYVAVRQLETYLFAAQRTLLYLFPEVDVETWTVESFQGATG